MAGIELEDDDLTGLGTDEEDEGGLVKHEHAPSTLNPPPDAQDADLEEIVESLEELEEDEE